MSAPGVERPAEIARADELGLVWLGGAIVLGLLESIFVLFFSWPSFDGLLERLAFVGLELALYLALGGAVALGARGVGAALGGLSERRRAIVLSLLAAPPCAYAGWAAFRGPRAQQLPAHQLLSILVAVTGVLSIYAAVRASQRLWSRPAPAARGRLLALLLGTALALHLVDEWALPRLYLFFHRGLELAALGVAAAFVVVLMRGPRMGQRRVGAGSLQLAVLALGAALAAQLGLAHGHTLATILLDRAPGGAVLGRLLLRLRPAAVPIPRELVLDERAAPLPPGLRLGSRDVVLVTIDALRADRLTEHVMPAAARLAAQGVRFDEAYTQVPHTSFAVATLLTGKLVYSLSELGLDAASHETLAQIMQRERYKTAAFFPPAVFFIDHERLLPLERSAYGFEYVKYEYLDAARRTDQVIDFFERERPAHAFVWVHYLEPHEPYDVHEGYTAGTTGAPAAEPAQPDALRRYEGELRYVDAELARLVAYLRKARPGALVVLAADHGEEFGEHGGRYHGTTLFDEQVRVPLSFSLLDGAASGRELTPRRVDGPVGLVDVAPTLLSLLGVPASAKMRGRDLSPWMAGATAKLGPELAEIDRKKMVVDGSYKLVCDLEVGRCALYDRAHDPAERRDVSGTEPAVAARMRGILDGYMSAGSRFEAKQALAPDVMHLIERGRLGDAAVAPDLVQKLPVLSEAARHEVLALLATLPTQLAPSPLEGLSAEDEALADLLRARAGDAAARTRLDRLLAGPAPDWLTNELRARAALATGSETAMAQAIQQTEDKPLVIALAEALARTRKPSPSPSSERVALDALLIALAPVRSRAEVAHAIGVFGDPRAIDPLLRWLPSDPYVPVRVEMVRALAALAAASPGDRARVRDAFFALLPAEREGGVLCALATALAPLPPLRLGSGIRQGTVALGAVTSTIELADAPGRERLLLVDAPKQGALSARGLRTPVLIVDGVAWLPASPRRISLPAGVHAIGVLLRATPPPTPPAP